MRTMKSSNVSTRASLWLVPAALAACTNPAVDPAAELTVQGDAKAADGSPLASATVRLVRFFHPEKLLEPSVEDLFGCSAKDCGYPDLRLEVGLVKEVTTGPDGKFEMNFLGEDIVAENGVTDVQGRKEGSNLVTIVLDPADGRRMAGTFTYDFTFGPAIATWPTGTLELWGADAKIDATDALTAGQVEVSWKKLERPSSSALDNYYRLGLGDPAGAGPELILFCREGVSSTGGRCESRDDRLAVDVSAISLFTYYSGAAGRVGGYLRAAGATFRHQVKIAEATLADPNPGRVEITPFGIWAVTDAANQSLRPSRATDGDPRTQETIQNNAKTILVKLDGAVEISDAGLLGATVEGAHRGCVVVETTARSHADVDVAKREETGWEEQARFCGGNGSDRAMSALINFRTPLVAAWMRFRAIPNDALGTPSFQAVGEVAVYGAK